MGPRSPPDLLLKCFFWVFFFHFKRCAAWNQYLKLITRPPLNGSKNKQAKNELKKEQLFYERLSCCFFSIYNYFFIFYHYSVKRPWLAMLLHNCSINVNLKGKKLFVNHIFANKAVSFLFLKYIWHIFGGVQLLYLTQQKSKMFFLWLKNRRTIWNK